MTDTRTSEDAGLGIAAAVDHPRERRAAGTWTVPDENSYPTGREWRDAYLQPLADLLDAHERGAVRYGAKVVGVSRAGRDLLVDSGRETDPFAVHVQSPTGHQRLLASAVVPSASLSPWQLEIRALSCPADCRSS